MDIGSNNKYPAGKLSNFSGHRFHIDYVQCNSMEGFLQGLKFENPDMQAEVCLLVGFAAKRRGAKKNWQRTQTLYWRGKPMNRLSPAYQRLLDRAYRAMFEQSNGFRAALTAAGENATFTHSIGRRKESETVLTIKEFCSRVTYFRDIIFSN